MTRKELREVLDEAAGHPPRVDLAEAAWARGVGMRRRRRAVLAGGGTVLAAAAVVGALVLSGGLAPDEDVAPAVPTQTPGPTQVEPGPADLMSARTFIFLGEGTEPDAETIAGVADLGSLDDVEVPAPADLAGTTWDLYTAMRVDRSTGEPEPTGPGLRLGDELTIGADVPTTLSFVEAEDGDTLLVVNVDDCGGAAFQEDLVLEADGRFVGQDTGTEDIGCSEAIQAAEDYWMLALPQGGWLHHPSEDVLLLSVVGPDPAPTGEPDPTDGGGSTESPDRTEAQTVPEGTVSIGEGVGLTPPEGWTYLPLVRSREESEPSVDMTCLLPPGETRVFDGECPTGIEIRVGVEHRAEEANPNVWWDPGNPDDLDSPVSCYAAPVGYGLPENAVTFDSDPETGTATVNGHAAEWFRWSATCAEGQEFTAEAWRFTDLGIELRSRDGSQDLEAVAQTLTLSDAIAADRGEVIIVSGALDDTLTGERTEDWPGRWPGTGEDVTLPLTEDTVCLVTRPGGYPGADHEVGSCHALAEELVDRPLAQVITSPEEEVALIYLPRGF